MLLFLNRRHSFLKHRSGICLRVPEHLKVFAEFYPISSTNLLLSIYMSSIIINLCCIEQKAELRCLLPRSLLNCGFFPTCTPKEEKRDTNAINLVSSFSWSGQRKMPSYINKLVFPEDFLTALRTLSMKEDELYRVASLLEEVCSSERFWFTICINNSSDFLS